MPAGVLHPVTGGIVHVFVIADRQPKVAGTGDLPAEIRGLRQIDKRVIHIGPHHKSSAAGGAPLQQGQGDRAVFTKGSGNGFHIPGIVNVLFLQIDVEIRSSGGSHGHGGNRQHSCAKEQGAEFA